MLLLRQGASRQRRAREVCFVSEQLLSFHFQVRELFLKDVLLTPKVVVQDNLTLQVAHHLVTNLVCLVDSLRDCPVSRRELIQSFRLLAQVFRLEDEPVLHWVL